MPLCARTAIAMCFAAIGCGGGGGPAGPAPVASVTVGLAKSSILVGETSSATATARDASANALTGRAITWSTGNSSVLTVSQTGSITGVAAGTTSVIATSEGKSGTATVTVSPPPVASVAVSLGSTNLTVGSTTQATATVKDAGGNLLTGRAISWSSDNQAVATVSGSGLVTAMSNGNANIVAGVEGITASAPLLVQDAVIVSTTVSVASPTGVGSTTQATASFKDASGNSVTGRITGWSSDNTAVATVTSGGVVTSVGLGTANISVTSDGPPGSAPMTVAPLVGFGSSAEKIRIVDIGTTYTPTLSGATAGSTTFSSRATSVVRVDAQGTITGIAEGQGWVAATAPGFAADSIYVIVPRNATGPVLRSDLTAYNVRAGRTVTFDLLIDTRTTAVGGAELTVGYTTSPFVFQSVKVTPTGSPAPIVSSLQSGLFRVSLASGSPLTGQLSILQFTFTAPITSGVDLISDRSGYLILTLIDLVDPTGADLLPVSTSMRIPIIITQ